MLQVDEIYINTIREYGLYDKIWQAFAVFLPVRSVGVQVGGQRPPGFSVLARHGILSYLHLITSHQNVTLSCKASCRLMPWNMAAAGCCH